MSEVNEAPEGENPEVAAKALIDALPADQKALLDTLVGMIDPVASEAVAIQTAIRGAEGGKAAAIAEILNTSDDEEIVKVKAEIEAAEAKIEAAQKRVAERRQHLEDYAEAKRRGLWSKRLRT